MFGKFEEWLDHPLVSYVVAGMSFALGLVAAAGALGALIACFCGSVWWFLAVVLCGVLAGACFGFVFYLCE